MSEINDFLKAIGLTDTESKIYLTGLAQGPLSATAFTKDTHIQRTTVYHALDTLLAKGLSSKKRASGRLLFSMTHPQHLHNYLNQKISLLGEKKQELEMLLPALLQKTPAQGSGLQTSEFEGIEGVKMVIEQALYCRSRKWEIIAPAENFFSEFDKAYARYYLKTRVENGILTRSLWEKTADRRVLTPAEIRQRNPRILPPVMWGKFNSVIILFDDKVCFISSFKSMNAVIIQSKELLGTMSAVFEGLWSVSAEYGKV